MRRLDPEAYRGRRRARRGCARSRDRGAAFDDAVRSGTVPVRRAGRRRRTCRRRAGSRAAAADAGPPPKSCSAIRRPTREFVARRARDRLSPRRACAGAASASSSTRTGSACSAPSWVALREIEAALPEKGAWIVASSSSSASARGGWRGPHRVARRRRRCLPRARPVTVVLDPRGGAGAATRRCVDARNAGADARALRIGLPQRRRRRADPGRGAELAAAPGAPRLRRARGALCGAPRRSGAAARAVVGADALGQRQRQRRGAPALAPDPFPAADDRLRRRARAGAPARDEPQPALLEVVALGGARLRARARRELRRSERPPPSGA